MYSNFDKPLPDWRCNNCGELNFAVRAGCSCGTSHHASDAMRPVFPVRRPESLRFDWPQIVFFLWFLAVLAFALAFGWRAAEHMRL